MQWADTKKHTFRNGDLFLGANDDGQEIGVYPEVHAITIASSGAGKGACVIIPNIKRWQDNLLGWIDSLISLGCRFVVYTQIACFAQAQFP